MQRALKRNQRGLPKVTLDVDAYENEPAARIRVVWKSSTEMLVDIVTTDHVIDRAVYPLCGLTEKEIAVMEKEKR